MCPIEDPVILVVFRSHFIRRHKTHQKVKHGVQGTKIICQSNRFTRIRETSTALPLIVKSVARFDWIEENMSKSNGTAASQAHAPESKHLVDQPHAHSYPGKKASKAGKVSQAMHNASALASGRGNSMGVSAGGSHKGMPYSYNYVGHDGYDVKKEAGITSPELPEGEPMHEAAKLAAGKKSSIGMSADGSHKNFPGKVEQIGQ